MSGRPARLPEQPDDWTEPGAFPVLPGVFRIPLPLPEVGLRAVNVYAIEDREGIVLVDAGWSGPDCAAALQEGLQALGHRPSDVVRVVVTHAHHDHYTQSIVLRREHGATVLIGRGEAPTIDAYAHRDDVPAPQPALLRACGAPELAEALALEAKRAESADDSPWGEPDGWLDDGDPVAVGGRELQVVATPGHTAGHIVLRDPVLGALFAGDHVLPHITPSIGYERAPERSPLRSYLASLRLVHDLPDALLLPAHGPVTASVHVRIEELLAHHEQRLEAALGRIRAGASTAYEVAAALPWTRRAKRIDQLETVHAGLAVLEIEAHLDVLAGQGLLDREAVEGVTRYAVR